MNLASADSSGEGKVKGIVRITKISKLYKLVKISRLIRLIKILKNKKKIMKKMKDVAQVGAAFERLMFYLIILLVICHGIGCSWIFIAKMNQDPDDTT